MGSALYGASLVVAVGLVVFVLAINDSPRFTAVFVAFVVGICGYNAATASAVHARTRTARWRCATD